MYGKLRELEGKSSSLSTARERGRSFDSLSDLTNIDMELDLNTCDKERIMDEYEEMRRRFEKAVLEIRAMRKELREAHAKQDALELEIFAHKQEATRVNDGNQAQIELMAARIQDLTGKLASSEKQLRLCKQKLVKTESREKRRSLSLKGREAFQISQELEDKLLDLETKVCAITTATPATKSSSPTKEPTTTTPSSSSGKKERKKENRSLDKMRLRRKSLDSATSCEPMKVLIRLSTLEAKVASASETQQQQQQQQPSSDVEKDSSECSEASSCAQQLLSGEALAKLKRYERAVTKSKRRLEKCLGSKQVEDKVEKCLREVNDILENCLECKRSGQASSQVTESVGAVVSRLEAILKEKMLELTMRRQSLIESGKLDEREKMKLIAERVAFESVILRQIKCALERGGERTSAVVRELLETSQLITNLKCKIHGTKPKTYQNTSYTQYLTKVLANKLVAIGGGAQREQPTTRAKELSAARRESLNFLLAKQRELDEMVKR